MNRSFARPSALALALLLVGCASLPAGTLEGGALATEVPARFFGQHVLVSVRIAESDPAWMLLDTGASMTVLDIAAMRELGVAVGGATELEGIGAAMVTGGVTAEAISIQVVGSEPYRLHRPVADLSPLEPYFGAPMQGILGGDLFLRFVVEIDYLGERVILHDPRRFRPRGDDVRVSLEVDEQIPHVQGATMLPDGRDLSGRFVIDTGSNALLTLYSPFTTAHGILEALPATIGTGATGVGGESPGRQGRLRAFRVGPFLVGEPVASVSLAEAGLTTSVRSAGHVGAEVLRRFTVTIDYRRGALYLRPNSRLYEPFHADMAGFQIRSVPPEFHEYAVHWVDEGSPAARAGLEVGDVLLEVDGKPAAEYTIPEVSELTRSQPGRVVRMLVRRGSETLPLEIRLERRI